MSDLWFSQWIDSAIEKGRFFSIIWYYPADTDKFIGTHDYSDHSPMESG